MKFLKLLCVNRSVFLQLLLVINVGFSIDSKLGYISTIAPFRCYRTISFLFQAIIRNQKIPRNMNLSNSIIHLTRKFFQIQDIGLCKNSQKFAVNKKSINLQVKNEFDFSNWSRGTNWFWGIFIFNFSRKFNFLGIFNKSTSYAELVPRDPFKKCKFKQ